MLASLGPSWWGFRVDASFCRPILEYRHVVEAEIDSPCVSEPVLPASSSRVCPKLPGPRRGFLASVFCHSSDGKNFAAIRVGQRSLQGSHLAPSADLRCSLA